jgi:quercetin dioxygenase-like cupin family protein
MTKIKIVPGGSIDFTNLQDFLTEAHQAHPDADISALKLPEHERRGTDFRTFIEEDGGLQLFEVRCSPNLAIDSHSHAEDEIIYVLEGEISLGRQVCPAGSSVFIAGNTLYGFKAGPQGCRFLNFRPRADRTYTPRSEYVQSTQ